ncbi:PaaI family thioesterase [Comamonas antarctica]|uniref:PaaI family thioesterase n=1 Tax=Comamonas antarctica TaxID=2743470 RepID=UPI0028EACD45|nr:PaaI family thioesterase [Comamonas antarctica]
MHATDWKPHTLPGFMGLAGPLWTRREEGGWAYGLQVQRQHLNPAGVLHGGALLTLVDHALSTVAWQALQRQPCLTLQLDSQFLASVAEGGFVVVRARVTQRTRSLLFLQGLATVEESPVLQAQAIMKVQPP